MKLSIKIAFLLIVLVTAGIGQYKSQPEIRSAAGSSLLRPDDGNLLFGWFDPSRLSFHNSYSLSYMTSGSSALSLGALTSSIGYRISDPLSVRFDVSLLHSPYSNLGGNFANNISGVYLTRAELNYKPSKNTQIQLQFQQLPSMYWMTGYNPMGFNSRWLGSDEEEIH
jgi:hypothetical protein